MAELADQEAQNYGDLPRELSTPIYFAITCCGTKDGQLFRVLDFILLVRTVWSLI